MKQWLAFWSLGLIWGSSFLLIKIVVEALGPLPLVSLRVGLAAALMIAYLQATHRLAKLRWSDVGGVAIAGFLNVALPFSLIARAEESIDSSLATILNSTVPLFSLVIAHFFLKDERLNLTRLLGLMIGYGGIIMLTWRGLQTAGASPLAGQVMMLGASLSYGIALVFIRARLRHIESITIAGTTLLAASVMIIPLTLVSAPLPSASRFSTDILAAVITLAVINTVAAYFLFYYLLDQWGTRASVVTYVFPPVGIALGAIFLNETVDASLLAGAALILGGVFAVNYKPGLGRWRKRKPASAPGGLFGD
ncbi:MAG: DMT family transporter [Anaerolineae bacterium]|nr:DMT family transporter [Anaerolineae bacterium]